MRILTILFILLFSPIGHSACSDDFNTGLKEYGFATGYFESGLTAYNTALDLSRNGSSDFLKICNLLVDSVTGFNVAKNSYLNCSDSFNQAVSSCSEEDSRQAGLNKDVCLGNEDIASGNHTVLRNLLKNTCFKRTSILKNVTLEKTMPLAFD